MNSPRPGLADWTLIIRSRRAARFFHLITRRRVVGADRREIFCDMAMIDYVDTRLPVRAVDNALPSWNRYLKICQRDTDWRLLAAISYQESHWDPLATCQPYARGPD